MKMSIVLVLGCALAVSGCASIIDGHSEEVAVNTSPKGADCTFTRKGLPIGKVDPTPGSLYVEKTKDDITIACDKHGYEEATYLNHSGIDQATWGDIVLGGFIGWGIDSASGSDNHYTSPVNITLSKN